MWIDWTPEALDDLDCAIEYIALDKPSVAKKIASRIYEAAQGLAVMPYIGRPGRVKGTRELVVSGLPYIMPYTVKKNKIIILGVIHGAMKWPDTFSPLKSKR